MLADVIGRVETIEDVVAAMRGIDAALPDGDGVKWFNYLYLNVTEALAADTGGWRDRAFIEQFDVVFARLYFEAVVNWERNQTLTPHAWRPLLRMRFDTRLARLQFALAGMNAHINRDLAIALDRLAAADGDFPPRDGERHIDFRRVNDLLERVETTVRAQLSTGLIARADRAFGDLDSVVAMWNVRKAREAAWTNGELLWQLRHVPRLRQDYLTHLDQFSSFAGRGLLLPRLGGSLAT